MHHHINNDGDNNRKSQGKTAFSRQTRHDSLKRRIKRVGYIFDQLNKAGIVICRKQRQ